MRPQQIDGTKVRLTVSAPWIYLEIRYPGATEYSRDSRHATLDAALNRLKLITENIAKAKV